MNRSKFLLASIAVGLLITGCAISWQRNVSCTPVSLIKADGVTPESSLIHSLQQRKIAVTPTLITLQRKFHLSASQELRTSDAARMLPNCYRNVYWDKKQGLTSTSVLSSQPVERFRRLYPKAQQIIRDLFKAGVSIHSGTDTPTELIVPGAGLLEELTLLNQAGLTPEQVLEISTRHSTAFSVSQGSAHL